MFFEHTTVSRSYYRYGLVLCRGIRWDLWNAGNLRANFMKRAPVMMALFALPTSASKSNADECLCFAGNDTCCSVAQPAPWELMMISMAGTSLVTCAAADAATSP